MMRYITTETSLTGFCEYFKPYDPGLMYQSGQKDRIIREQELKLYCEQHPAIAQFLGNLRAILEYRRAAIGNELLNRSDMTKEVAKAKYEVLQELMSFVDLLVPQQTRGMYDNARRISTE
jgi:hypothetical protein